MQVSGGKTLGRPATLDVYFSSPPNKRWPNDALRPGVGAAFPSLQVGGRAMREMTRRLALSRGGWGRGAAVSRARGSGNIFPQIACISITETDLWEKEKKGSLREQ